MALEYSELTIAEGESAPEVLNGRAGDGWRVHTAYSPTHYLLERGVPNVQPPPRAVPSPPSGPSRQRE